MKGFSLFMMISYLLIMSILFNATELIDESSYIRLGLLSIVGVLVFGFLYIGYLISI